MPQEVANLLTHLWQDSQAVAKAPWLWWALLGAAGICAAWNRRAKIAAHATTAWRFLRGKTSATWGWVRGKAEGAKPKVTLVQVLLLLAVIHYGAQRDWSKLFNPDAPVVTPDKPGPSLATAVTYVYEKDATAVPSGVEAGLNRLNREKNIRATLFEEDTVDGDGDVPDQYKVPLTAARTSGLPSLVVTAGSDVLNVVKDPRTEQQVFEAIAP